jgi:hypothetical protein
VKSAPFPPDARLITVMALSRNVCSANSGGVMVLTSLRRLAKAALLVTVIGWFLGARLPAFCHASHAVASIAHAGR